MENASKALIMAGGVLIGVLILTLAVYLIVTFGADTKETYDKVQQQQLEQFNLKYTSYCGKDGLTIYDVITVANMAKENNKYYNVVGNPSAYYYISVIINPGNKHIEKNTDDDNKSLIESDIGTIGTGGTNKNTELPIYKCEDKDVEYDSEGRIKKITFSK